MYLIQVFYCFKISGFLGYDGGRKCNFDKKFDRIMFNACKYFIKIVYDGQGALIVVS